MRRKKRRKQVQKAIVLIGFMGCGKTTAGLRLSYRLQRPIEDTDKIIEAKEGRSISEIFAVEGEDYFRRLETDVLKELKESGFRQILSVGGGTPLREENQFLLHQIGTVVWLRIRPETVYERLKEDRTRPLLQGDYPLEKITELIQKRDSAYTKAADVIVDVDGLEMDEVLNKILVSLKGQQKYKRHRTNRKTVENHGKTGGRHSYKDIEC